MTNRIGHIEEKTLTDALSERYLAYAMSTIMSRSLPDVRDGLKPVQRRLLYAMHQLHLSPDSGFKKCARVVGDVIGKFHPHGDASVYEALVRLAQDFAARYPLVEGQGNFGSVDGDGPAAMRYTESRLTLTAMLMLEGLGEETVDQRSTYDNEDSEPVVLPAFFPNLLANGASGIAVGMATNIPPHNAPELYAAGELLLRNPQTSLSEILELMPGPDFPTGGIIQESPEDIALAYEKGRGSFRIRARWETEHLKGGNWQIIVTELPYQVQKSRLIEQIARLLEEKKLPLLADVSDDSAADIRLILHPRSRSVQPEILMETLFRSTALESRFSLNMNILAGGRIPEVMSLRGVILAWLDHVHDVFIRRTSHRLQKVQRRLEILEGFIRLYLNLDETIRIIREEDDPRPVLMAHFALSEVQVEYVLNMRLRSLRKLEEVEIRREQARLLKEEKTLQKLLASEPLRRKKLGEELARLRARYEALPVGKRRTDIKPPLPPVDLTALAEIEREPLTVLLSREGWIRTLKGHSIDPSTYRFKEGDALDRTLECQSTDRLCLCGSSGRSYTLKALDIPGGRGFGQPVRLFADLGMDEEVVNLFPLSDPNKSWLIATSHGRGMRVMEETLLSEKRGGKQIFTPSSGEKVRFFLSCGEADRVLCLGEDRRALIFLLEEVPGMMRGKGVMLQKQGKGELKTVRLFSAEEGLLWKEGQNLRKMKDLEEWQGRRGSAGKPAAQWMLRK